jgi:hypothetical protein
MKKITGGLFLAAALGMSSLAWGQSQTIQVRISNGNDDVEERGANATTNPGEMYFNSSDLELVNDGTGRGDQVIGMRFTNISIPQGAIVSKAYIQFTVDEDDAQVGTVILKAEDVDNSGAFVNTNFNVSSRATTADSVLWQNIPQWPVVGVAGPDQQTPDISALIQAVVGRAGWASGNSLTIIASGTGERTAESYDGSAGQAPLLVVEYQVPQTTTFQILTNSDDAEEDLNASGAMDLTSSDLELFKDGSAEQVIGLRYANVGIPANSKILSAHIQFTVDEVNTSGQVDALITAENTANAAPITNAPGNLSNRSYFLNPVIWTPGAFATINDAGVAQRTADITSLIQGVIDQAGWKKGNALLIGMVDPVVLSVPGFTGNTGKRVAQSKDKSTSRSPKLVVTYVAPAEYQLGGFPVAKGGSWKYSDDGTDLTGTNWTATNYNDSTWKYGDAVLGYGNGNDVTTLDFGSDANNKRSTYYLRHIFEVNDASQYDSLVFDVLRDDGVVVYVNGVEAFRQNMPAGPVGYNTFASATVGGSDETDYFRTKTDNLLQDGINVIAVELHQASASSSDLSFDMEVGFELPPLQAVDFPLNAGADWNYMDKGICLDGTNWTSAAFNDDNWDFGPAPLGYGDAMNTTISYGPDANNKYVTYYFRRGVNVDMTKLTDTVIFSLRRDDGAIVYVNGVEVIRDNMTAVSTCDSTAPSTISGSGETEYQIYKFPKSIFNNGVNQIAVEIHNRDVFSSDLGFDLQIENTPFVNPSVDCNAPHIGCFTSIKPTSQTPNLIIAGEHNFQLLIKQGDLYTHPLGNLTRVGGNNDFTGFVATNGSSELGHLSINHETSPGGVTMADIHYDRKSLLWVVDTTRPVDFYDNDLVTTVRNCSGGITPWGTIITCEETATSADVNGDGYVDVGWNVEIDPRTSKVIDYDNDGKADKLWAMGAASHENAAISEDGVTVYTGEDGGSSAVFKFVADTPGNLSAGKLYALKLDGPLVGGEPTSKGASWIAIPNTTQTERNSSRSLAISLGATNFNGVEDIEFGTIDGKIYFTSKGNGRIYRFDDNGSKVANFETFVGGTSYDIHTNEGVFNEAWGGGNDNLCFDDKGNLWVLQDGGRNYVWVVRPDHSQVEPKVELFASFPNGSEPCGLTFSPDYRFGFISVQHPSGSNTNQMDATGNMVRFNASATLVFALNENLGGQPTDTSVVSNSEWMKSTVVSPSNYSGYWGGVNSMLPAEGSFTINAEEGQPYGYPSINPIQGSSVIKTGNSVTYFRKNFVVNNPGAANVRLQTTADDQAEIYINGTRIAHISDFGRANYKAPGHDVKLMANGTVTNGYNGGDSYNYVTTAKMDTVLDSGLNEVIVVVRNLGKPSDMGGFSFRMDIDEQVNKSVSFTAASEGINIYPNPTNGAVYVSLPYSETGHEVSLFDINGRMIDSQLSNSELQMDLSGYPNGVYFLKIKSGDKVITEKVVKQ